jgi:hypothetical protein
MTSDERSGIRQRLSQLRVVFATTRKQDRRLVPLMAAVGGGALVFVLLLLGLWAGRWVSAVILGVLLGVMAAMIVFGRRASRAMISTIEGKTGAAAAILQSMRGVWFTTPAVAVTRKQDFVHRVVGRPGVVLVGEGARARVSALLAQEKRRVTRAVTDIPVHTVSVGDGEQQVPLGKLQSHVTKLPRAVKRRDVAALDRRLGALGDANLPIPKGPIPRAPRRRMR